MKTSRVRKISVVLKLIAMIMALVCVVLLSACGKDSERAIVRIGVTDVPDEVRVAELDSEMHNICGAINNSGIKFFVEYDDGTREETPINFNLLDDEIKQQLNTEGTHSVTYIYRGEEVEFEIDVKISTVFEVKFYDKTGKKIISTQKVAKGSDAIAPENSKVAVAGFDFVGWNLDFTNVRYDMNVYPLYVESVYTVRFYDFNGNVISEQSLKYGESAKAPEVADVEGYDFVKWDKTFTNVKADLNVKPVYDINTFTVRFYDNNGNLISEQTVGYGHSATEPTDEEKAVELHRFLSWDRSFDDVKSDLEIYGNYERAIAVHFYNCKNVFIATKYVFAGETVEEPTAAEKKVVGFNFSEWDTSLTNIQAEIDIRGIYTIDNITDTDGDGLTDYMEVEVLGLDYTKKDTDGNGVFDADEDCDGDGLSNLYEINIYSNPANSDTDSDGLADGIEVKDYKTNPANSDTDGDGLTDYDEVKHYGTSPINTDTDGDGARDNWEINNGFAPTTYNASFAVKFEVTMSDGTTIKVEIAELPGEYVEKIIIGESDHSSVKDIYGAICKSIKYDVSVSAKITIVSNKITQAQTPMLMYFNTVTKQLEPVAVTVSGNELTATIDQSGNYALVDRAVFEGQGQWEDVTELGKYTSMEIVFVIDDSDTMANFDYRLAATIEFINKLPSNVKVGIVTFSTRVQALTASLTTKDNAKVYLASEYFNNAGITKLYSGVKKGLDLMSAAQTDDRTMRVMVVLSDGLASSDSYNHDQVVNMAKVKGVNIYAINLCATTSNGNCLVSLSESTGGQYYYAGSAEDLNTAYGNIFEVVDVVFDNDNDGIADFFESNLITVQGNLVFGLNKNLSDVDYDGYLDGEEIEIYLYYSETNPTQAMVWGVVTSNPVDYSSVPVAQ